MVGASTWIWTVVILGLGYNVDAWSREGHERIALVAQALINGTRGRHIRNMLHGDLYDVAGWEDEATNTWPDTAALHWHQQKNTWTCTAKSPPQCDGQSESPICAFGYFFNHLHVSADYHDKPDKPIKVPKTLASLKRVPSSMLTPVYYLRWITMIIGDLHQPMHWLSAFDYGENVELSFRDDTYSLKSFWEEYLPSNLEPLPSNETIVQEYLENAHRWRWKEPADLVQEWAEEAGHMVCGEIYSQLEENHADGTRTMPKPVEVTQDMFEQWGNMTEKMTSLAGQRLAFLLLDMLKHRKRAEAKARNATHTSEATTTRGSLRGSVGSTTLLPDAEVSDEREVAL